MAGWRVLIVEDDPAVMAVHGELLAREPGFDVVDTAASGEAAYGAVARTAPDLMLLDLSLRGENGLSLVRRLRAEGAVVEVIAVTASRDAAVVRALVHLGAVDYLVKPFSADRLRQALNHFRGRMAVMNRRELTQVEVDELSASGRLRRRWLPKGLSERNLDVVRAVLQSAEGPMTADEVGIVAGMARVTTRRYLEYLVTTEQAQAAAIPDGHGRPAKRYALLRPDGKRIRIGRGSGPQR